MSPSIVPEPEPFNSPAISSLRPGSLPRPRIVSLDAFRGLTIAGMILVNNPGSWSSVYSPLRHAEWDGWTPTDLVFPFFLFIVGVAIPLALGSRIERGDRWPHLLGKILFRSIVIFALGLALNGFPKYDLGSIRLPGVLQRISLCYGLASLVFLTSGPRFQLGLIAAILVGYAAAMLLIPVPGSLAGDLSRSGNLAAYLDRTLLAGHTYKPDYDPEGLLSTLPALATTLIGMLAGRRLRAGLPAGEIAAGMFSAGLGCLALGLLAARIVPINKPLWSSSYVLVTAGLALQGFGLFHWVIESQGFRRWAKPLVIFGLNPITAFVLSGLLGRLLGMEFARSGGGTATGKGLIYRQIFASWASPLDASLLYAIAYLLLWWAILAVFARYRLIIKV